MAFQFWLLYGEFDGSLSLPCKIDLLHPGAVDFSLTISQRVSVVTHRGVWFDTHVIEMSPSCMTAVR